MTDDNVKSDYDYSRQTYYDLIEKGRESLEDMIEVARQSEHPRAYEVLSGMIKNISDVNDKLMDLNKKQKDIDKKDDEPKQIAGGTTNNNLFLTTADLQKMMSAQDDENIIDVKPTE
tara:strand:+ start:970 stop:1320 length:351 start_codon:yes stop_codon:yes gene_type:complete